MTYDTCKHVTQYAETDERKLTSLSKDNTASNCHENADSEEWEHQ